MVCINPRPGESIETLADRLVGEGALTEVDRDAVVDFAAYLRDTAVHGEPATWGPNLLRRHRQCLGLSHAEIDQVESQLWIGSTPGPTIRNVPRSIARPAGAPIHDGGSW